MIPRRGAHQPPGELEMESWLESIELPPTRTERQRRALRNAIARRRLELIREERELTRHLTDVWDETEITLSTGEQPN